LPNPEAKWWIALSQFPDGGARKLEGTLFIDFLQQLPACLFRHAGSGLSTPALKRRPFLVTPRGQFSKAREETNFFARGFAEYVAWYLGINEEQPEDTKGRHEFPFGDFGSVSVLNLNFCAYGLTLKRRYGA
jgi:hypothetical protein